MRTAMFYVTAGLALAVWAFVLLTYAASVDGGQPAAKQPAAQLYVFSGEVCAPCKEFELDEQNDFQGLSSSLRRMVALTRAGTPYALVKHSGGRWENPKIAAEYERAVGQKVTSAPTFWVRGASQALVGYDGPKTVVDYVRRQVTTPPPAVPYESPEPQLTESPAMAVAGTEPAPPDESNPDEAWSDVTIVVLARNQVSGKVADKVLSAVVGFSVGKLERAVHEATGGRAKLILVPERLEPRRFAAVQAAAGLNVKSVEVLALVRKQPMGLKGFIAARIERDVLQQIPGETPLEVIFERQTPRDFKQIEQALAIVEPNRTGSGELPWWAAMAAGLVGMARRTFFHRDAKEAA